MITAHVEGALTKRLGKDEAEAVDVGLQRHLGAEEAELLRRNIVVFAGKAAADDGAFVVEPGRARDAEVDDFGARHISTRDDDIVG